MCVGLGRSRQAICVGPDNYLRRRSIYADSLLNLHHTCDVSSNWSELGYQKCLKKKTSWSAHWRDFCFPRKTYECLKITKEYSLVHLSSMHFCAIFYSSHPHFIYWSNFLLFSHRSKENLVTSNKLSFNFVLKIIWVTTVRVKLPANQHW